MNAKDDSYLSEERIEKIKTRISAKVDDYERYSFTPLQDCALKTFFDLAQEFEDQRDFYLISTLIPKLFFNLECALHLVNQSGTLDMVCSSAGHPLEPQTSTGETPGLIEEQTVLDNQLFVPIKGNIQLPYDLPAYPRKGILGLFEIYAGSELTEHMKLFFEKYVNRIGFQLHNRFIAEKNKDHLRFIKNLVNDIGHNVIVPNMYFKLFFRRMKGKIKRAKAVDTELRKKLSSPTGGSNRNVLPSILLLADELKYLSDDIEEQFQQILAHYEQTSLFLETLLRRSHFEKGRYVIEPRPVDFREEIIRPQLKRYLPRLQERNIAIDDQLAGITDQEITVVADVGLISQAYANLFSNAVKYTQEARDEQGNPLKFIALGMENLENYFAEGKDGIKFNMFSTGPQIASDEATKVFDEGYRGGNVGREYGTGHGLQFIKDVVELHGGVAGYEPTPMGNNFYFILPK